MIFYFQKCCCSVFDCRINRIPSREPTERHANSLDQHYHGWAASSKVKFNNLDSLKYDDQENFFLMKLFFCEILYRIPRLNLPEVSNLRICGKFIVWESNVLFSLGVEPVDDDIIRQKPRDVKQPMLTKKLLLSILMSAAIVVAGTMSVFYKEVNFRLFLHGLLDCTIV